jgi:membrane peptidoglycan carboxypeptidase
LSANRPRRRASQRRDHRRAAVAKTAVALLLIVGGLVAGSQVYASAASSILSVPTPSTVAERTLPSDTLIYDRTGTVLLADLHTPGFQHYEQPLANMGKLLPAATVDVEDASFWSESGVNAFSILRAAVVDLQQRRLVQGGSTITQQLVKLRVVGGQDSFTRKVKEAVMAMEVSGAYSKSQILEMYLNTIYYGNSAYGAEAAAKNYFHIDTSQLDLAQASMLAGLPDNANVYNPFTNWDASKARQRIVLDALVRNHAVTQADADAAYGEDISPPNHMFRASSPNLAPGFVDWISSQLASRYGPNAPTQGGLRVTTSLDWKLQQLAQQAITDTVAGVGWRHVTDGALVALDPRTGQVLAMVGSAGAQAPGGQYNLAVWPPRNPGSSFKIFTYTRAIESRRYTMVTPIHDEPIQVAVPGAAPYSPANYDGRYHGTCQLQQCLGNSLNVPAVQVEMVDGVPAVAQLASDMGAPPYLETSSGVYTNSASPDSFGPSLTLGGYGETPLQMATGTSVLAAQGVLRQNIGVLGVDDVSGNVLQTASSANDKQVLDPNVAYVMSQILSNDTNRAMTFGRGSDLTLTGRTVAAKTGTTDNFTDGWTVGYTPSLVAAVWMGNTNFQPMTTGSDAIYVAAPAWHRFMQSALDAMGKGNEWYVTPAGVNAQSVDGQQAYFLTGTSPSTPAPALPSSVHLGGARSRSGGGNQAQP